MEFKVGDKVKILDAESILGGKMFLETGLISTVTGFSKSGLPMIATKENPSKSLVIDPSEYHAIKLIKTKNQRISALEEKVAELQAQVDELKKPKEKPRKLTDYTNNEKRKMVIEQAKLFVEEKEKHGRGNFTSDEGNDLHRRHNYKFEFFVKERKVTCIVHPINISGKITYFCHGRSVGRSLCHPHDVFNEHIGKAIALGRALGLDVSEFEQAVQPDEVVVGMEVLVVRENGSVMGVDVPDKVEKVGPRIHLSRNGEGLTGGGNFTTYRPESGARITNDTNAEYPS